MDHKLLEQPINLLLWAADQAELNGDDELRYLYLRLASQVDPSNDKVRYQFGRQCVRTERYTEALAHLKFSLDATGPHAPTVGFLMECHVGLDHPRKALRIAAQFPNSMNHTKVKEMYIKAHYELGNFKKLTREFGGDETIENKASKALILEAVSHTSVRSVP